jgi:SAM-dependent methyltransferase
MRVRHLWRLGWDNPTMTFGGATVQAAAGKVQRQPDPGVTALIPHGRGAASSGPGAASSGPGAASSGHGTANGRHLTSAVEATHAAFPDWRFAPNIAGHPDIYEIENRALDPDGHVLAAMRNLATWHGRTLVDLGCGTGYWLPGYAADAARVIGIEPDPALRARAAARIQDVPRAEVMPGSAEHLPLPDRSADVVHARFAYFLGPGIVGEGKRARSGPAASPGWSGAAGANGARTARARGGAPAVAAPGDAGLAEVLRVLRPGGSLIVIDNDYRWGQFADLLAAAASMPPQHTANALDSWWRDRGATRHQVRSQWRFASRADLAAVLSIEVPGPVAHAWLARHPAATSLSYGYVLFAVTRDGHMSGFRR